VYAPIASLKLNKYLNGDIELKRSAEIKSLSNTEMDKAIVSYLYINSQEAELFN